MDPEFAAIIDVILQVLPLVVAITAIAVGGSLIGTWMKIKNGYPLQNSWGMALHPKTSDESNERIKLLTSENAQLRAELGSVKDRLETIERIITDEPARLSREIEQLHLVPSKKDSA